MNPNATNNFDANYDAIKLNSINSLVPNIASKINNVEYAINSFDTLVNNQIPLQIKTRTLGIFNLTFIGVNNFIPNMVFKDNATQTLINIATDTTITLFISDTTAALTNYSLVWSNNVITTINETKKAHSFFVFPNPGNDVLNIVFESKQNIKQ